MEERIGAGEAEASFERILHDVAARGASVVVERDGEPVAAVVPIELYRQFQRARSGLFAQMRQASERAGLTPDEADQLTDEAIRAVRVAATE